MRYVGEMGNVPSFLTPEEYQQLHEETGCEWAQCVAVARFVFVIEQSGSLLFSCPVTESQIRRLYSRFAHLDKRSKGYLV